MRKMQSPRDKSNLLRQAFSFSMHSGQLTWQWKHFILKRTYIFKWWIFHCHVSLPEVFQYFNMCTNHKNRRSPAGASYERLRKYVLNVGGDCEGTSIPRAFVECLSCFWSGKGLGFESHGSSSSMCDFRMRIFSRCGIVMFMTFLCRNFRSYLIVYCHINKITNILGRFFGSTNLSLTYEKASYGFNYSYLPPARYEVLKAFNVCVVSMVSTACHHWICSKFIGL